MYVSAIGIIADGMSYYLAHYYVASCKYAHQIKQTTTSYDSATLNEKGMVSKDKGWGMSNLVLWGGKPMCCHLVCFATFLVSLVNLFTIFGCCWLRS